MIKAIVAVGKTEWEAQFVSGLSHPMTGIQVQRRCVDAVDVLAVAKVIAIDVVIISDHTLRVDQEFISELTKQKIRVIALTSKPNYFESLGALELISIDPNNPLTAISTLSALLRTKRSKIEEVSNPIGELIFIGGFGGGTGKTRLALELANEFADLGKKTLLVDGDTYGPTICQLLNQAPTSLGILEICRKIERKSVNANLINKNSVAIKQNLHLIAGLIKNSRWVDLRASALREFWQLCLTEFDFVVVDAGPVLEPDPLIAIETGLPKRNLVTTSALISSNKVVLTSRADAVSITRLIKGCTENNSNFDGKALTAVILGKFNKREAREVVNAVALHTEVNSVNLVELNSELISKVEEQASFIGEFFSSSEIRSSYQEIANLILEQGVSEVTPNRLQKLISSKRKASVA